jgi:hypothetical protein
MTTETNLEGITSYRFLYNFLLVLTEDQIFKLRNIAIGIKNLSSFSEREIRELEVKLDEKRHAKNENPM